MRRAICCLLAFGLMLRGTPTVHADLVPGDVNVIGYRSAAPDTIAFVTWVNLAAGDKLHFTDSGFFSDGTMRDSEEVMSWTAPSGGVAAGTVVVITSVGSSASADFGGAVTGALSGLSGAGDQVFVGTTAFPNAGDITAPGSPYSGVLLYGLHFRSVVDAWDSDASTTNTSALPASLNGPNLNIALTGQANGQYAGTRSGLSVAAFKAMIHDKANWTQTNDAVFPLSSTDFTIVAVPEASAFLFGGVACCAFGVMGWRRRRQAAGKD